MYFKSGHTKQMQKATRIKWPSPILSKAAVIVETNKLTKRALGAHLLNF